MPIGHKKPKTFRNTEIAQVLDLDRRTVAKMILDGRLGGNTLPDIVGYVKREKSDLIQRVKEALK